MLLFTCYYQYVADMPDEFELDISAETQRNKHVIFLHKLLFNAFPSAKKAELIGMSSNLCL